MVNGVYLQFGSDQKPYAQDGTTFVPSEILAQALGQTPRTVTTNGYSPLRASAEEAGYTVYWDQNFETAVLLDPEEAAAAMDESFTILNGRWRSGRPPRGRITRPTAPSLWIPPSSTPSTGTRPMPSPPPSASFSPRPAWNSPHLRPLRAGRADPRSAGRRDVRLSLSGCRARSSRP